MKAFKMTASDRAIAENFFRAASGCPQNPWLLKSEAGNFIKPGFCVTGFLNERNLIKLEVYLEQLLELDDEGIVLAGQILRAFHDKAPLDIFDNITDDIAEIWLNVISKALKVTEKPTQYITKSFGGFDYEGYRASLLDLQNKLLGEFPEFDLQTEIALAEATP